jgi:hypothetical protein
MHGASLGGVVEASVDAEADSVKGGDDPEGATASAFSGVPACCEETWTEAPADAVPEFVCCE